MTRSREARAYLTHVTSLAVRHPVRYARTQGVGQLAWTIALYPAAMVAVTALGALPPRPGDDRWDGIVDSMRRADTNVTARLTQT